MLLESILCLVLGFLGGLTLFPQQVYAHHLPRDYHHHHHQRSHRHRDGPNDDSSAGHVCAAPYNSPETTPVAVPSVIPTPTWTTLVSSTASASASTSASAIVSAASVAGGTSTTGKANVIVPFYAYPTNGAWTPLENLITAHPKVKFTVIVNPDNGPSSNALPDENFLAAVPRLTAHSNVRVIGYVRTAKATKSISEVEKEISTYAGWPSASGNEKFAVQGIFLDEAASEYSADAVSYYQQLKETIKGSEGLGEKYVVTNPGTVPDSAFIPIPDSTVIFESPYAEFQQAVSSKMFDKTKDVDQSRLSTIIYSIPSDVDLSGLVTQVNGLSSQTYLGTTDTYMEFDSLLNSFVPILAST